MHPHNRHAERAQVSVIAGRAWSVLAALPPPGLEEPTAHHASPRKRLRPAGE
jgi:hypothetical protein